MLAFHVLDVMESILRAAGWRRVESLTSTASRPAAVALQQLMTAVAAVSWQHPADILVRG